MGRRKHSKIDLLKPEVKKTVEEMILSADFTYKDIAEYIADSAGESISQAAICNYAKGFCEEVAAIKLAHENFAVIAKECAKYPNLDTTEGIVQMMSSLMMTAVRNLSPEDLQETDPLKLIKQASELVRAVSYKRNLDIKAKEISEAGFDAVKEKLFAAGLAEDKPEVYEELVKYLENKKGAEE